MRDTGLGEGGVGSRERWDKPEVLYDVTAVLSSVALGPVAEAFSVHEISAFPTAISSTENVPVPLLELSPADIPTFPVPDAPLGRPVLGGPLSDAAPLTDAAPGQSPNELVQGTRLLQQLSLLTTSELTRWVDANQTSIEELVANLYDHGGLTEQDHVELSLASEPDGIRVTIVDPGKPFDPWAAALQSERPERGGAAGIPLVRAWAQFVGYEASPAGNRLELLLPLRWKG